MVGLCQPCPFVVPRPIPTEEKKDKPSLTSIERRADLLRFPSKYDVCLGTNANILSKRKVACNFFKSSRLRCETLATFAFVFILYFSLCYKLNSFVNVFPGKKAVVKLLILLTELTVTETSR